MGNDRLVFWLINYQKKKKKQQLLVVIENRIYVMIWAIVIYVIRNEANLSAISLRWFDLRYEHISLEHSTKKHK